MRGRGLSYQHAFRSYSSSQIIKSSERTLKSLRTSRERYVSVVTEISMMSGVTWKSLRMMKRTAWRTEEGEKGVIFFYFKLKWNGVDCIRRGKGQRMEVWSADRAWRTFPDVVPIRLVFPSSLSRIHSFSNCQRIEGWKGQTVAFSLQGFL